ncbi:NAD(P)-binding protein [Sodiomyces alkalinus F11]|uniref:Short-chain dehydrogenase/reductase 3 n=1 Tax=Sodiomyces alkalinus (strain CBS 110278 / VKM F-3762 / F11) TaxID=1314773 RepID=A0A3N2PQN8_SODAK|nr:NAD(P)-binding protein [Sodiomyces alkalinus F11]ROT36823.1 NAD(P)-binding protein [Sodiomyces alkalinus F11]
MPPRKALLPREGLTADPIFKLFARTALNPALLLPLVLLARYTKQGGRLTILHPTAYRRLRVLLYCGLARWFTRWLSSRVLNNWTNDTYTWSREVVLVTGGAGGIGGHIARLFADRGVTVAVLDIQPNLTFSAGPNIHYFQCDITSPQKLAAAAHEIRAQVGNPTILINNAGVARGKTILGATEHDIRFTFDVNALAHYWTAREFLPAMVAANHGMVVTVASLAAYLAVPDLVDYSASKAAALAFHEGLTAELATRYAAKRVRTVLVTQGYAKTPLFQGWTPDSPFLMPALEPETVAEAVVDQVLSGRSGHVVVPGVAGTLASALRALPHWYQLRVRAKGQSFMAGFSGRQVVEDPGRFYAEKEATEG